MIPCNQSDTGSANLTVREVSLLKEELAKQLEQQQGGAVKAESQWTNP
jgi:hypothetical protein